LYILGCLFGLDLQSENSRGDRSYELCKHDNTIFIIL